MTNPFTTAIPDGGLIVSCQARAGSVLEDPHILASMAAAAAAGGACGIRANGPTDVAAIAARVSIPIIGINKTGDRDGVYITPTPESALEVARAGAQIIALDGTSRSRPGGQSLRQVIDAIRAQAEVAIMADVDTLDAGLYAQDAGADVVASTLSGYTGGTPMQGPDVDLVAALASRLECPIVAEGRIRTDADLLAVRSAGAYAMVIGTAITDIAAVTQAYRRTLEQAVAQ